jgi:hypothetical protein
MQPTSLNNLVLPYSDQGRYTEVEPLYRCSLAIAEKALGPEHLVVATNLNSLTPLKMKAYRHTSWRFCRQSSFFHLM